MIAAQLYDLALPPGVARLVLLTDEVMAAAECVCKSYRAAGGYTVPLSINLRRLDGAVREWQQCISALSLDSDVNGFDRSERYSNGQSETVSSSGDDARSQAREERRAEATPAEERKPPHRATSPASPQSRGDGTT